MTILIRQAAEIPTAQLDKIGPVEIPLSSPAAELIGRKYFIKRPGVRMMGVWECSPGRWQRTIMQEEFAHFIEGSARFIPEDGEPIDIKAGDTIWFPPNSRGVWEIDETVRKVYLVLYPRSRLAAVRARCASVLSRLRQWMDIRPPVETGTGAPALARKTTPEQAVPARR